MSETDRSQSGATQDRKGVEDARIYAISQLQFPVGQVKREKGQPSGQSSVAGTPRQERTHHQRHPGSRWCFFYLYLIHALKLINGKEE